MRLLFRLLSVICVSLLLSSCATIFTKSTYPVSFYSTPAGADIVITNKKGYEIFSGITPTIVPLKSGSGFFSSAEYYVKISKPGYEDHITTITSSLEGWYFGNIFIGGLIGMLIVDPATGAMWTIDQEIVNVGLKPTERSLQVVSLSDIDEKLQNHLISLN